MATVKRFIAYALPEDVDSNQIQLFVSATETGTFTLDQTLSYTYASRASEVDNIDTTKWYKIRFRNSTDGNVSAYSDVFPGSAADDREPFASISTTFDGASYSTTTEFYAATNLNSTLVAEADVVRNIKTARAYIDLVTDDVGPVKYSRDWGTDITRRKYNAQIELLKQTEICLGAAISYRHLADDRVMVGISGTAFTLETIADPTGLAFRGDLTASGSVTTRSDLTVSGQPSADDTATAQSISIGQTSISSNTDAWNLDKDIKLSEHDNTEQLRITDWNLEKDLRKSEHDNNEQLRINDWNLQKDLEIDRHNNAEKLRVAQYKDQRNMEFENYKMERYLREADLFEGMAVGYAEKAELFLNAFRPTVLNLRYGEDISRSKFLNPTDIFNFAITNVSTETVFTTHTADFTGLGDDFNGSGLILGTGAMAANTVDGVLGVAVDPLESRTTLVDSTLTVNGTTYFLDSWIDNNGNSQNGVTAAGSSGGYRLNFNTGVDAVSIEWLNNAASGTNSGFDLTGTDEVTFVYYVID